jgi:hypothetical protein
MRFDQVLDIYMNAIIAASNLRFHEACAAHAVLAEEDTTLKKIRGTIVGLLPPGS